jgi:hypothetical protein
MNPGLELDGRPTGGAERIERVDDLRVEVRLRAARQEEPHPRHGVHTGGMMADPNDDARLGTGAEVIGG